MVNLKSVNVLPESALTQKQKIHLYAAKALGKDVRVYAAKLPYPIIAAFEVGTRNVYISPGRLDRLSTTVDSLIHEDSHYVTGEDDGTQEHQKCILKITGEVISRVEDGLYDEVLIGAEW